jgi:Type VI secretion system VasI, EvfG, VC_A0118
MFARIILACAALPFGLMPATAEELPNLSRVIICKLIKDDVERLRCYDRALSEAPADAPSQTVTDTAGTARVIEGSWHVSEGKSATDGTPQLVAALEALGGRAALILRCQHGRTEAYVTLQSYVGAATPLPVTYTINDGTATDTRWLPSQEGNALFVPTPTIAIAFIRSLSDQATLALTVHDFIGRTEQMRFKLGPIAELRDKIAASCNWPADTPQAGTPPAPPPAATAGKLVYVPAHQHRWNVSARHPHQ